MLQELFDGNSSQFNEGDEVIVTGYDMGMNTPGGFGEYINVPVEWVVKSHPLDKFRGYVNRYCWLNGCS